MRGKVFEGYVYEDVLRSSANYFDSIMSLYGGGWVYEGWRGWWEDWRHGRLPKRHTWIAMRDSESDDGERDTATTLGVVRNGHSTRGKYAWIHRC